MAQQETETSLRTESAKGCVVLVFSTKRDFLEHYRGVFSSLGLVPITVTTAVAAAAILRLMIVGFVVVDQSNGSRANRKILTRVHDDQPHALALVVAQEPDPHFRREALALGAAEYLNHPVAPDDFVQALQMVEGGVRQ